MKRIIRLFIFILGTLSIIQTAKAQEKNPLYTFGKKPGGKEIYIPREFKNMDFSDTTSRWCYQRSASSNNIIVFWESGFGNDPSTLTDRNMQVDIQALLDKGEEIYSYYRDTLGFINPGHSRSDQYRMMFMILYQKEWLATGAGYDDVIGALWVNPSTMKPVGDVIAHEVGHSFQYQVKCDGNYGFRDQNYVGAFWEQCAQAMAWQLYPQSNMYHIPGFIQNSHLHFNHEDSRYQSWFLQEYWKEKRGKDCLGKVWRLAKQPEDPLEAYARIFGLTQEKLNDEIFEYACKTICWDFPLGGYISEYIQSLPEEKRKAYQFSTPLQKQGDIYQIADNRSPQSYGFNIIALTIPADGKKVKVNFSGLDNSWSSIAGWRWGFVGVKKDGTPVYGKMHSGKKGQAVFSPANDLKELWLVVSGAPTRHQRHVWDEDKSNDENFPYQVKFTGCKPLQQKN